jgi:hypothetical protein
VVADLGEGLRRAVEPNRFVGATLGDTSPHGNPLPPEVRDHGWWRPIRGVSMKLSNRWRKMLDRMGETTPPNEQCQVMRSVGLSGLVRAGAEAERCA